MATNDRIIDTEKLLSVLKNEPELIIKPFYSGKIIYEFQIYCLNYLILLFKELHRRLELSNVEKLYHDSIKFCLIIKLV
jgi:hypothetical protein